jgi:hypothetical protein
LKGYHNKKVKEKEMSEIQIFVQGEGIADIKLVRVPADGTVRDLVEAALPQEKGQRDKDQKARPSVTVEDSDEVLDLNSKLKAVGIGHRARVHIHRCRTVDVTVNFNVQSKSHKFPVAATVGKVKQWAVGGSGFKMPEVDALEHLLQVCDSSTRPDEDTHVGALVEFPDCQVCFDLVPKQRVEG